jgi:hypothetical protein
VPAREVSDHQLCINPRTGDVTEMKVEAATLSDRSSEVYTGLTCRAFHVACLLASLCSGLSCHAGLANDLRESHRDRVGLIRTISGGARKSQHSDPGVAIPYRAFHLMADDMSETAKSDLKESPWASW